VAHTRRFFVQSTFDHITRKLQNNEIFNMVKCQKTTVFKLLNANYLQKIILIQHASSCSFTYALVTYAGRLGCNVFAMCLQSATADVRQIIIAPTSVRHCIGVGAFYIVPLCNISRCTNVPMYEQAVNLYCYTGNNGRCIWPWYHGSLGVFMTTLAKRWNLTLMQHDHHKLGYRQTANSKTTTYVPLTFQH